MWPEEAQRILTNIRSDHLKMMGLSKENSDPANMIIKNLAVAPPPVRPSVAMQGTTGRSEDDLTITYIRIIKQNNEIKRAVNHGAAEV
jgi:DNA-directed RNA polymerase II subunit RPB1